MTKKSAARIERDHIAKVTAQMKKDQIAFDKKYDGKRCWSDLLAVSQASGIALAGIGAQFIQLRSDPLKLTYLVDSKLFSNRVRTLSSDIKTLTKELADLVAIHTNRTGGHVSDDDLFHSIQLNEQYIVFNQRVEALLLPTANALAEQVDEAERRMRAVHPENFPQQPVDKVPVANAAPTELEGNVYLSPSLPGMPPIPIETLREEGTITIIPQ